MLVPQGANRVERKVDPKGPTPHSLHWEKEKYVIKAVIDSTEVAVEETRCKQKRENSWPRGIQQLSQSSVSALKLLYKTCLGLSVARNVSWGHNSKYRIKHSLETCCDLIILRKNGGCLDVNPRWISQWSRGASPRATQPTPSTLETLWCMYKF